MEIYKYKNYKEYKDTQIKGYSAKVNSHSWVDINSIGGLAEYIFNYNPEVSFGLCHGTRRGIEQQAFIDNFKIVNKEVKIIGTEIAEEASKRFPNTIEWDFHNVKDEWINNVDFIYSNSFDHSYDPEKCLSAWMSCLNNKGLCLIEWTTDDDNKSRPMDPFAASFEEYKELFSSKYEVLDSLLNDPKESENTTYFDAGFEGLRYFFIIKNKNK